jgi:hypothetical protein
MPQIFLCIDGHAVMALPMQADRAGVGRVIFSGWKKRDPAAAQIIWQRIGGYDFVPVQRRSTRSASRSAICHRRCSAHQKTFPKKFAIIESSLYSAASLGL